jgi:hypothetical protein
MIFGTNDTLVDEKETGVKPFGAVDATAPEAEGPGSTFDLEISGAPEPLEPKEELPPKEVTNFEDLTSASKT